MLFDPVAQAVERQEQRKRDPRAEECAAFVPGLGHETLRSPFGEAEGGQQNKAHRAINERAVDREVEVEQPLTQHGVGQQGESHERHRGQADPKRHQLCGMYSRIQLNFGPDVERLGDCVANERHDDDLDPVSRCRVVVAIIAGDDRITE